MKSEFLISYAQPRWFKSAKLSTNKTSKSLTKFISYHSVTFYLTHYLAFELPFHVSVKFQKTVKSVLPQILFNYILPQYRQSRTTSYNKKLTENLITPTTLPQLYESILTI